MKTSHIYPGAHTLNSYLNVTNCVEAIEFYKKAFNAIEELSLTMPNGKVAHAEINIEGSLLMLAEENPEWGTHSPKSLGGSPVTLSLYVKDVDSVFNKAIEAGAKELMPISNQFYGDRVGQIVDPFGFKWHLATHIEDVPKDEMQERMNKMFSEH